MSITDLPTAITDFQNGLFVILDKSFYDKKEADKLYREIDDAVAFDKKFYIKIFGKRHPIPRNQTAYGDPGTTYTFSGMTVNAKPWIPIIQKIKADVEYALGLEFNFCLVNKYDDGSKYIGYHKDDEGDLGAYPKIASVSFGQERKFYFKCDDPAVPVVKTSLNSGSLCVMYHPTNKYYKHSVPKEAKVTNPRINLTFRRIMI